MLLTVRFDVQTETLYYGDRKISIRTSVLEEKATACNMLCCYADELEVGFFPYVEQVCWIPPNYSWTVAYLNTCLQHAVLLC